MLRVSAWRTAALLGVVGGLLAGASQASAATTYTVTNFNDGTVSTCNGADVCPNLRTAIAVAAANPPATIALAAGTYSLTHGEVATSMVYSGTDGLTLSGAGESQTVIDQNTLDARVFDFNGGSYLLKSLEVTGGAATSSSPNGAVGGGIDGGSAEVDLNQVALTGNSVIAGSGAAGSSSAAGSPGDDAIGGGLADQSATALQITDSTISDNTATGGAGGAPGSGSGHTAAGNGGYAQGAGLAVYDATLIGTTVYGNTSTGGLGGSGAGPGTPGTGGIAYGAGIADSDFETLDLVNSTVADNTATPGLGGTTEFASGNEGGSEGAGIDGNVSTALELFNDTIDGNTDKGTSSTGGNLYVTGNNLTDFDFEDTVVSNGSAAGSSSNCELFGTGITFNDYGHNAESDTSDQCGFSASHSDLLGVNPQLGTLANNGGPTLTEMPLAGSPLIRAGGSCTYSADGSPLASLTTDQRGLARGSSCDIGAVQLQAAAVIGAPALSGTAAVGETLSCSAAGAFSGEGLSYTYAWLRDGAVISGQSASSYTVQGADAGHALSCAVTAIGTAGAAVVAESPTASVAGSAAPRPGTIAWVKTSRLTAGAGGKLKLTLACKGGSSGCRGTVLLTVKRGKKTTTLGSLRYTLASGRRRTLSLKLGKRGRAGLRSAHNRLSTELVLKPSAGKTVSYRVRLV